MNYLERFVNKESSKQLGFELGIQYYLYMKPYDYVFSNLVDLSKNNKLGPNDLKRNNILIYLHRVDPCQIETFGLIQ
jgi:hypothetical protein